VPDSIVEEELGLLARVREALAAAAPPVTTAEAEAALVRELARLRDLLVEGSESKDAPAIHQQFAQGSALLRQLREGREATSVDPDSPYFAHLRLREAGDERDLCLGRATRIERGVRIVDWRNAPISKLFYRYGQGEEYEEEISGRLRVGEVVARRTVSIRHGELERVQAPEGTFVRDGAGGWRRLPRESARLGGGEGVAWRAWGPGQAGGRRLGTDLDGARRRADKRLPELAGLLDPSQFELIARPGSGCLAIRGAAGSGKTTVALHRIAFLAYDDPSVDSERTLFVTFSPALRHYVAHVLPALGVRSVGVTTFHDWASELRRRVLPGLPRDERADAPAAVQRLKLHPALLLALEDQVTRVPGPATLAQAFDDWASVLCNASLLEGPLARTAPHAFRPDELASVTEWCRARHEELVAWLEGDAESPAALDPEDDALLLRAHQLRVGPLPGPGGRPLRYRHLAIDELQDLSPVEVRVLVDCLDERRSLTLAGDGQQQLAGGNGFASWGETLARLGLEETALETLRVSYRSSREIVRFAFGLLGPLREDGELPRATRSGPPVECFRFGDPGACVAFLGDALRELLRAEPLASVAVLTPSAASSELHQRGLVAAEVPRVRRVEHQDFTFAPGVEVTEVAQAKGLEFDYVILVDVDPASYPDLPASRRLLHVGATRAVHQLWVATAGELAPLVRQALEADAHAVG